MDGAKLCNAWVTRKCSDGCLASGLLPPPLLALPPAIDPHLFAPTASPLVTRCLRHSQCAPFPFIPGTWAGGLFITVTYSRVKARQVINEKSHVTDTTCDDLKRSSCSASPLCGC
eukprot:3712603-Amphidinium_carterae.1